MNYVTSLMSEAASSETIRYLCDLIEDNKRPTRWLTDARRKLVELSDFLLSSQLGNRDAVRSAMVDVASTSAIYGSFDQYFTDYGRPSLSGVAAGAMYSLLRAYRITASTKYLEAARMAATFLRRMQCGDKLTSRFSASNASPYDSRFHYGAFAYGYTTYISGDNTMSHAYHPDDNMLALEALTLLLSIDGDRTYGDAAAVGDFNAATAALTSVMISECRAFWTNGAFDLVVGATVVGFGGTTPRQYFVAGSAADGASGPQWIVETTGGSHPWSLRPRPWAKALRSLYAVEGYSAQVASAYTFLRSTSANANAQLPSANNASSDTAQQACWGTYDPNMALIGRASLTTATVNITTTAGVATNAAQGPASADTIESLQCLYDPLTVGYLARIQSAQEPARFKAAKVAWHRDRTRFHDTKPSMRDAIAPLWMDYAGFNDMNVTPILDDDDGRPCRIYYSEAAAINGVIYRLPPFVFPTSEAR